MVNINKINQMGGEAMNRRRIQDELLQKMLAEGKTYKEIGKAMGVSAAAICKRLKRIQAQTPPESLKALTPKEQSFAIAVASGQSRINAAMSSFDVTTRDSAKAIQKTLMKEPAVKLAIDDLMEFKGIGREFRVEKLRQHMDNPDPIVSLKSLDMAMKAADDAGDRRGKQLQDVKVVMSKTDLTEYRNPASFDQTPGGCAICSASIESLAGLCEICCTRYPALTDKITRHWAGDPCAVCEDDRRCYAFCNDCKAANHV